MRSIDRILEPSWVFQFTEKAILETMSMERYWKEFGSDLWRTAKFLSQNVDNWMKDKTVYFGAPEGSRGISENNCAHHQLGLYRQIAMLRAMALELWLKGLIIREMNSRPSVQSRIEESTIWKDRNKWAAGKALDTILSEKETEELEFQDYVNALNQVDQNTRAKFDASQEKVKLAKLEKALEIKNDRTFGTHDLLKLFKRIFGPEFLKLTIVDKQPVTFSEFIYVAQQSIFAGRYPVPLRKKQAWIASDNHLIHDESLWEGVGRAILFKYDRPGLSHVRNFREYVRAFPAADH